MEHKLKIRAPYFIHIQESRKPFEIRLNDRDFQVGDRILYTVLQDERYDIYNGFGLPARQGYIFEYDITYVHHGLGMEEGYVALGIEPVDYPVPKD